MGTLWKWDFFSTLPIHPSHAHQQDPCRRCRCQFVSKVLATTEDHWHKVFQAEGRTYQEPKLVFYTGRTKTGCGVGQASAGPFYCPTDKKIYLDMSFYKELTTKYKASGDFAMAYVIAHEVGHHVQNGLGILGKYHPDATRSF